MVFGDVFESGCSWRVAKIKIERSGQHNGKILPADITRRIKFTVTRTVHNALLDQFKNGLLGIVIWNVRQGCGC
ncbi:hypothetical protein D3C80_1985420 [compost metagenome]